MDFGCPECGGRVSPGRWMCHGCEIKYLRLLRDVRPTVQALTSLAMKTSRVGSRERGGGTGFAPSPIDWTMADLRDELIGLLQDTAMHLNPSYGRIPSRRWRLIWTKLMANRTTLLQLPTAVSDYRSLRHTMTLIDRTTRPGEGVTLAGQCPVCRMPIMCPKGAKTAKCAHCGNVPDVESLKSAMTARLEKIHVTTTPAGAAKWVKENFGITITRKDVNNWRIRGKLHATDAGDGYHEYNCSELVTLAMQKNGNDFLPRLKP